VAKFNSVTRLRLFSKRALYLQPDFHESALSYLSSHINDLTNYSARKCLNIVREVEGGKIIIAKWVYVALKSLKM
jgi:hypothetical protein